MNADSVLMKRLEGSNWKNLPTERLDKKPGFVKWDIDLKSGYKSVSPGLSIFAIVAYEVSAVPEKQEVPMDIAISLIFVIAFVVILSVYYIRHHHKL